ncbi:MAG: copper resistance protein B [Novosphingobium sp.]
MVLIGSGQILTSFSLSDTVTAEPRLNINWAAQDIEQESVASGVTDLQAAVRVRKTLTPLLEIYGGVIHERLIGGTLAIAKAGGSRGRITRGIAGIAFRF